MRLRVADGILGRPTHAVEEVNSPEAAKLYYMWHAKKPDGAHVVPFEFPRVVMPIGRAVSIVYHSDKWEKDGEGYNYKHDFESRPTVYAPTAGKLHVRENPSVPTGEVLKADIDGQVAMPMLALVYQFVYEDDNNKKNILLFDEAQPLMCMTEDARGLVMFLESDGKNVPLFVRGGEMYVNSHGIIK